MIARRRAPQTSDYDQKLIIRLTGSENAMTLNMLMLNVNTGTPRAKLVGVFKVATFSRTERASDSERLRARAAL